MSSTSSPRKTKIPVTISSDVASEIDKMAKKKKSPRSQVMEKMLRGGLLKSKERTIKKEIETYYLSLTEKEKKEDREWAKAAAEAS